MVRLSEVAKIIMGQSPPGDSYNSEGIGVPLLNGPTEFGEYYPTAQQWTSSPTKLCQSGDLLFCVRGATAGRLNVANSIFCIGRGLAAIRARPERFDEAFLRRVLTRGYKELQSKGNGSTFINIAKENLESFEVPSIALVEQRRIADILDRAEALRAKRRAALAQLDHLVGSFFAEIFLNSATAPQVRTRRPFCELLAKPLRNGRSPSNTGKFQGKVLTLSAITGAQFDDSAWKSGTFSSVASEEHIVGPQDFLICRGNGNLKLVGKGYFPTSAMPDVIFPDTIIAACIEPELAAREYLEHVWNSPIVRTQVESLARTTNGTYKVNQTILEGIEIPVPLLPLQQEFARRVQAIDRLKAKHRQSLAEMDALFLSLQHRAFRGEL